MLILTEPFQISHDEDFDFWSQVIAHQRSQYRSQTFVPLDRGGTGNAIPSSRESFVSEFYAHGVPPKGGTLLLFDSVCLPHSVDVTLAGERMAIGGWWHELTAKL